MKLKHEEERMHVDEMNDEAVRTTNMKEKKISWKNERRHGKTNVENKKILTLLDSPFAYTNNFFSDESARSIDFVFIFMFIIISTLEIFFRCW